MSYRGGEVDELERGVTVSITAWRLRVEADLLDEMAAKFEGLAEGAHKQLARAQEEGLRAREADRRGRWGAFDDATDVLRERAKEKRRAAEAAEEGR